MKRLAATGLARVILTRSVHAYHGCMAAPSIRQPIRFVVDGMHCAGCAASARVRLAALSGVDHAEVDYATGIASVTPAGTSTLDLGSLHAAVREAGFELREQSAPEKSQDPFAALIALQASARAAHEAKLRQWRGSAIVAGCIWSVLEVLHWTSGHDGHTSQSTGWVMLCLAAIALVVAGRGFGQSAVRALRRGTTNMDTLVVLGVGAAFGLSTATIIASAFMTNGSGGPLYFAEAIALLAIISAGHWIEARASNRAQSAIQELMQLQPEFAEQVDAEGALVHVPVSALVVGDCVQVRPGARVPVDGIIERGEASIDESSLTGEPVPVTRSPGACVRAGTIALDGALVVRTTASGGNSAIGRIAQIVYQAQISQAPIARITDRVCAVFVPTVLLIALGTFVAWWVLSSLSIAVATAVTVLVISCPCALGIATPLALVVGTGEASRRGVLVRSAAALQAVAGIRSVAFDKTGTLTCGRPSLDRIDCVDGGISVERVLTLAAAAEAQSEHPLARAIVDAAHRAAVVIPAATDFRAHAGRGVEAMCLGHAVGVWRDELASARLEIDGQVAARLHLHDPARPQSREAISRLRSQACGVYLVTGDRQRAALDLASEVGIDAADLFADQTPESKCAVLEGLEPQSLMMVGDGINDAAALATASVGVAMGSASALAVESADVILMRDDPRDVSALIEIARETFSVVKQNLLLACAYNVIAIPAAACGLLGVKGPVIAAIAMGLSNLSVVANSLRLRSRLRARHVLVESDTHSPTVDPHTSKGFT